MLKPFGRYTAVLGRVLLTVSCLLLGSASLVGFQSDKRPQPKATVTVSGVVRAADTGIVLRDAEVRVSGGGLKSPRSGFTDGQGRYKFENVVPGRYLLAASKLGYATAGYGQNALPGEPKPLVVEATTLEDVNFSLVRGGVIVASLTDPAGEPVAGAIVNVYRSVSEGESRRLINVDTNGFMTHTDDRGEARIFSLPPGSYYVSAKMFPNPFLTGRPKTAEVFYPGTLSDATAQSVHVTAGQEVRAAFYFIDARLARLAGTVLTSNGAPYSNPKLQLLSVSSAGISTQSVSSSSSGVFSAGGVPPGTYLIQVRPGSDSPNEYANQEIEMTGEDVQDFVVVTSPPANIRGTVAFEDVTVAPDRVPESLRIAAKFVGYTASPGHLSIAPDWTFEISNILGRGTLAVDDRTKTWFFDSLRLGDRDVSDDVLDFRSLDGKVVELTLTRRPAAIMGTVVDQSDKAVSDYVVIAFSEDRQRWSEGSRYISTVRPDQNGQFKLVGLPPGNYHVAAVEQIAKESAFSSESLDALRAVSTHVTLARYESKSVTLLLTRAPY